MQTAKESNARSEATKNGSGTRTVKQEGDGRLTQPEKATSAHRCGHYRLSSLIDSESQKPNTQSLTATGAARGNHAQGARINALDTLHQLGDVNNVNLLSGRGNRTA